MVQTCRGFVLCTLPYGESDRIVRLFTETMGPMTLLAPRARGLWSRLRSVTMPVQEAMWSYTIHGGGLPVVRWAESLSLYAPLRSNLLLCAYAAYWCEVLLHSCPEKEPQPALYRFLQTAFTSLAERFDADFLTRVVELRVADAAGWKPVVSRCVHCGADRIPWHWAPSEGGRLCSVCWPRTGCRCRLLLSSATRHVLPKLVDLSTLEGLGRVSIRASTRAELARACAAWLAAHLPCSLRTSRVLQTLLSTKWLGEGG
ncbi:DNA repair protein RecO [Pasteuria penetrans]|uniref:DNA repair protein RecO n=1 Tax=Pasteuria penetrans TaxID=86005 RepID=UPI000FACD362|nr:DNA repair protein RecO [Pasteuria penetrans]